jgi:glyoxylase-like metal-dependent hydrolase (beta-lactamase superfamily II)
MFLNPERILPVTATLTTLKLPMPMRMGNVNAYLLRSEAGFFLIDTGSANARKQLLARLSDAGCIPGSLRLVLLTHGDFDHTGNAAYLRSSFGVRLAMHRADSGMGESGDMFENRKKPNALIRSLIPLFTGFGKDEHFSPDLLLENGDDLSPHGLDARVLSLPGHSKGSIGILTAEGDLFCGDLFENTKGPVLNSLMDDREAANVSLAALASYKIRFVYPGHGEPFAMEQLAKELP